MNDYTNIKEFMRETSEISRQVHGSYAYMCGYYESVLADVLTRVSEGELERVLGALMTARTRWLASQEVTPTPVGD